MKKRKQPLHPLAAFLQQQPRSKQRKQHSPFPFVDMSQDKHKRKPLLEQIQHTKPLFGPAPHQVTGRKKIRHPRMPPLGDHDRDGAINLTDCQPLNPFKQDWPGDPEGHSEAAKKGWEKRRGNVPRSYNVSSLEDLEKQTKGDFKKHSPAWKKKVESIGKRNGWGVQYRSSIHPDKIDMSKGDKALYLFKDKNRNKWVVAYRIGDLSTTSMKTYDTVEEAINNLEMLIMII